MHNDTSEVLSYVKHGSVSDENFLHAISCAMSVQMNTSNQIDW